jgi:hypothetical protein
MSSARRAGLSIETITTEEAPVVLTPKVTEISRGSAHRREVLTVRAGRPGDVDDWPATVRRLPMRPPRFRGSAAALAA